MSYAEFLASKAVVAAPSGIEVSDEDIHPLLFPWQRDIVKWAARKGSAALFEECGLGKTIQQLEWARLMCEATGGKALVLAPLAVTHQTILEGRKIDVDVTYCRSQEEADTSDTSIIITNYEMVKAFDPAQFVAVVLDESSILKSFTGKTKRVLLEMFKDTPYRLCCTATPAPNDQLEFGNHADFLGIMRSNRMISRWFINDSMQAGHYRLKKHAATDFWRWMTTWAVCISKPSDLGPGYSDDGFIIPDVNFQDHVVRVDHSRAQANGQLFLTEALSATTMWKEKRATAQDRCEMARSIVNGSDDAWILWCDTNYEADILKKLFPEALEVRGSHSINVKRERLIAFSDGTARKIITKPDIAGFGLNWQHCHNQCFVGVTYSFEKTYQALRRSWRYGQDQEVQAHLIYSETEGNIMATLDRKKAKHLEMQASMNLAMREEGLQDITGTGSTMFTTEQDVAKGEGWELRLGDCVTEMGTMPDNSIDCSVFSPPFSTLYIYTDTRADMGNNDSNEKFFEHFQYLIPELWRITKLGRLCVVHCKDLPLYMNRDGAAGLYDFPGRLIQEFERQRFGNDLARWAYHSRVTIWKDPVIEMQRTKNHGLLWKNFTARGEVTRQGMADYLIVFRKWDAEMPDKQVHNMPGEFIGSMGPSTWDSDRDYSIQVWQKYASPVWFDIRQTRVLNYRLARSEKDEKHICPLQLDVIERSLDIWTNEGDLVFDPFTGIGSTGHVALSMGRRFLGTELKREYFDVACDNLQEAERLAHQDNLFTVAGIEV